MALRVKSLKDLGLDNRGVQKRSRFQVSPKSERTYDGIVFASKGEMRRYCELKRLEQAGLIRDLRLQPEFRCEINGMLFCRYTADFSYFHVDKNESFVEDVKSTGTAKDAAYRLRKKAAELYHGIKITEVLSR